MTARVSALNVLSFINGDPVEGFGDADIAKLIRPLLLSCLEDCVKTGSKRLAGNKSFGSLLIMAFGIFPVFARYQLSQKSETFTDAWEQHFKTWYREYVSHLEKTPGGLGSFANMKLPSPDASDDVVQAALTKISEKLFEWYINTFGTLAANEAEEKSLHYPQQGPPYRENMSTVYLEEWYRAWNAEFRGKVLMRLELKLHLNASAVKIGQHKHDMSRIIPVVQASGTGKSRLAEEYVKENFGIILRLKNGDSYPPAHPHVYRFFKDLTELRSRAEDVPGPEMILRPKQLPDLSSDERKKIYDRIFEDGTQLNPTAAVYDRLFEAANDLSIPKRWAAAGRLRVACFLAGFFNTMVECMKEFNNLAAWQNQFLYKNSSQTGVSDKFWDAVLENALTILSEKSQLYDKWLRFSKKTQKVAGGMSATSGNTGKEHQVRPSNGEIRETLAGILHDPMDNFFSHPVTKACLSQIEEKKNKKLPFLFVIDEAAFLFQTNYMHCFMWVLDQPVVQVLKELSEDNSLTDRFFVLMLGTHSQISHFAPNIFPSDRLAGKPHLLPSPFLSFNWDVNVTPCYPPLKLRDSESLFELAKWGRSMWGALFEEHSNAVGLGRYISYVQTKLQPAEEGNKMHRELSILAVMAIRLHLDLDCAAPARSSQLVCSKMRWLVDVGMFRSHITTTYGSEPILVEAAACMMNSYDETNAEKIEGRKPFFSYISEMIRQLSRGYISRGSHGELTARLLLILAKDEATRQVWNADPNIQRVLSKKSRRFESDYDTDPHLEAATYYENHITKSMPYAFYHRAVPVKVFLQSLLDSQTWIEFKKFGISPDNTVEAEESAQTWAKKWAILDNAYVNFTHFARVKSKDSGGMSFTKYGILHAWCRHAALFMGGEFPCGDILVPMAYLDANGNITFATLAFIIISVKNHSGTSKDALKKKYLAEQEVLGTPNAKGKYLMPKDKSNLLLSLRTLDFIRNGADNNPKAQMWIRTTEQNPYIAFVMSIGAESLTPDQRFVPETQTSANKERIIFALRGLHSTFNLHSCGDILKEIVQRHDISGEYTLSVPDFQEEMNVVKAGRVPLDNFHKAVYTMFPSLPGEVDGSSTESPTTTTPATSTPTEPSRANTPISADFSSSESQASQFSKSTGKAKQDETRPKAKPRSRLRQVQSCDALGL